MSAVAVFDFGKTHLKAHLVLLGSGTVDCDASPTPYRTGGVFPSLDDNDAWRWVLKTLARFSSQTCSVDTIVVVAHGATAALVTDSELSAPIMDYEWAGVAEVEQEYERTVRNFAATFSPPLANGLNLGRQLFWLRKYHPEVLERTQSILMYSQYWGWRLTGVKASEVTSLGCHTDLWDVSQGKFSDYAESIGAQYWPPLRSAWQVLGPLSPALAAQAGLKSSCQVLTGIHDSNASYLRHIDPVRESRPTVISTGTWVVVMAGDGALAALHPQRDMLANVDVFGRPVPSARFMGGREYEMILGTSAGKAVASHASVQRLVSGHICCWPCISGQGGPYSHLAGSFDQVEGSDRAALGALYLALMTKDVLERLEVTGEVIVEGPFSGNEAYLGLLAALIVPRRLLVSDDTSGTLWGALALACWPQSIHAPKPRIVSPWQVDGLTAYGERWKTEVLRRDRKALAGPPAPTSDYRAEDV